MQIESKVKSIIGEALQKIYPQIDKFEVNLETPNDKNHGDYSSNIAMVLTKELKKNPREIAQSIVDALNQQLRTHNSNLITKVEIAGPGFINFYLSDEVWKDILGKVLTNKDFGNSERLSGKRIMVEFAHPNPFKSFHIGHLRNIILGESIVRLLESQGAEVIRTNYQGDVGMHIAKCLWAFRKVSEEDYPSNNNERVKLLGKCYSEGATAFEEDEEIKKEIVRINKTIYASIKKQNNNLQNDMSNEELLIYKLWETGRKWSLDKFGDIYKRVYSDKFVREYMESEVMDICLEYINQAVEKGILEKSQGAIIFDGSKYGLDTRVFLNSEGLPTYEGKELGLAYKEFTDFGKVDFAIHNVAVEQVSFFKVTFKVQELMDPEMFKDKQYHNAYEFVGLKKGKMSSRKGNVVLGEDVLNLAHDKISEFANSRENFTKEEETIEEISIGAVKYSFLKISPFTYLAFDIDESVSFDGNSGPYLQYTNARAKAVIRKSSFLGEKLEKGSQLEKEELDLLKHIFKFSQVIEKSSKNYSPNYLASFLYELAGLFNAFYNNLKIIGTDQEEFRITLTKAVTQIMEKGLDLLGIKAPERM